LTPPLASIISTIRSTGLSKVRIGWDRIVKSKDTIVDCDCRYTSDSSDCDIASAAYHLTYYDSKSATLVLLRETVHRLRNRTDQYNRWTFKISTGSFAEADAFSELLQSRQITADGNVGTTPPTPLSSDDLGTHQIHLGDDGLLRGARSASAR